MLFTSKKNISCGMSFLNNDVINPILNIILNIRKAYFENFMRTILKTEEFHHKNQ